MKSSNLFIKVGLNEFTFFPFLINSKFLKVSSVTLIKLLLSKALAVFILLFFEEKPLFFYSFISIVFLLFMAE